LDVRHTRGGKKQQPNNNGQIKKVPEKESSEEEDGETLEALVAPIALRSCRVCGTSWATSAELAA
jgi:hypothetical protein